MADFTKLRLRRTALTNDPLTQYIFNTDYTPVVDQNQHIQNATISYAEPWIQSYHKQLWVDNVCINPTLTVSTLSTSANTNLLSVDTTFDVATSKAQTNIEFNYTSLLGYLATDLESLNLKYPVPGGQDNAIIYSPFSESILELDDNMSFNPTTATLNSDYLYDAHIHTGADIIAEQITFENINNVLSNHLYLDFYSEFGKRHGCDITSLANPNYGSTLDLDQSTNILNLAEVNVDESIYGPFQLSHGQQINVVTELGWDEYGRVKAYGVTRYILPASDGGGGGGVSVTQTLSAVAGLPITGTSPVESYTSSLTLSDDSTPVVLTGTQPTNNNGTDVRFRTTQDTNEDVVVIVVHCIDGGEIQAS